MDNIITMDSSGNAKDSGILIGDMRANRQTPVSTTSGTTADVATGIPSWVEHITVSFKGVSGTSAGDIGLLVGDATSFKTSNYVSAVSKMLDGVTPLVSSSTSELKVLNWNSLSFAINGAITLTRYSDLEWMMGGSLMSTGYVWTPSGRAYGLSTVLTRLRLQISSGAFDAGEVSVSWI